MSLQRSGLVIAGVVLVAIVLGAWALWLRHTEPGERNAVTKGYRIESGLRYAYTMEVPIGWETTRGETQEGARAGRTRSNFVSDIAVAREVTSAPSLATVKQQISSYLQAGGMQPGAERAIQAGGFEGWSWDLPAQPEENSRPKREPYRLVVLYDPRGYQWVLTFSWSSPEAFTTYEAVFDHALKTFRTQ